MSFDIFLEHFENGESAPVPKEPVLAILAEHAHSRRDEFGYYVVEFPDGVDVEFSAAELEADGPFTGCALNVRAFSPGLALFIFRVASAGRMAILPAMEGACVFLTSEPDKSHLPAEMLETLSPVVVHTAGELEAALSPGFGGWKRFRDEALGG